MELEEMKENWRFMEKRLEQLEMDNLRLVHENVRSKVEQLRRRLLLRLWFVVLLLPMVLYGMNRNLGLDFSPFTRWAMTVFVVFVAVRQLVFMTLLERIDPVTMTVREVVLAENRFRMSFKLGVMVGLGLAAGMLAGMIHDFYGMGDRMLVAGAWWGLGVGVIVGLRVFLKAWRSIGELRRAIADLR
ncbi:MAG: hypothetical protein J6K95_03170 [Rikenellaceae bacterium]|nr:hypothetical protein [Rikenellaceae bacterium]